MNTATRRTGKKYTKAYEMCAHTVYSDPSTRTIDHDKSCHETATHQIAWVDGAVRYYCKNHYEAL